jgi:hypothetical protein
MHATCIDVPARRPGGAVDVAPRAGWLAPTPVHTVLARDAGDDDVSGGPFMGHEGGGCPLSHAEWDVLRRVRAEPMSWEV